ncbi:hybrid sensor histidine kinase/response regulator [Paraliomyxa miuraensis]|uniref:hybrid sensor histidine kinase/response regulator n=1 Tax=Paraliomyxa miuraensis TaxID=376150 RepID=UPI002252B181|nr:response regulator [Paraliomyxa miuraensis]MCX4241099.1 response regulator [Paraliomyxa miuraensis]
MVAEARADTSIRTLLVEDDPLQRDALQNGLRRLGLDVTAVPDANAGLVAHLRQPFELLVIDMVLPGMDGLKLCAKVRSIRGGEHPYILMITGRGGTRDLTKVLDAGADDFLVKPIEESLLLTRVRIAERHLANSARHRQAREALARSEVDFRRVIERAPLGIIAYCDERIVYVNAAAVRSLGHERSSLLGTPLLDLVPRRHREATRKRMERFERTDVPPPPIESEFLRRDGSRMTTWVIPMTRAMFDGARASFLMFEDITDRKAAERELRLTQFAIDHAADPAFWINRTGRVCYVNHAACAALGYPRARLLTMDVTDIDPSLQKHQLGWAAIGASGTRKVESHFKASDGRMFPVEISTNVLRFDGEEYLVAFARDLTERKRMQASLQKADRLASVGSLAAGVAHEINNPLAYVLANLELLGEDLGQLKLPDGSGFDQTIQRTLQEAAEGANRVRRIVRDLRSFARADEEALQSVDIHEVIDAAIDIADNEIRHRARLEKDYGEVPAVRGAPGRLTQVFLNLLVNAAHAIPEEAYGDQFIRVSTRAEKGNVYIDISDTGSGIPDDIIDRIFDPFFTTKAQGMGTGLGLSICHGIVTGLGGEIKVQSRMGEGSTFSVMLPASDVPVLRRRDPSRPHEVAVAQPMRILVVDDEPSIGAGIKRALGGHTVEVAGSGREAIDACEANEFDLVLCDVMMPDVSGMDVYSHISETRPDYGKRFVFMTGGAFTPKAREFLESVANEHIEKPFSIRELRTLVSKRAAV